MSASAILQLQPYLRQKFERYSVPGAEPNERCLNLSGFRFFLKSCTGIPDFSQDDVQSFFTAGLGGTFDAKGRLTFEGFMTALRSIASRNATSPDYIDSAFVRFIVNHVVPHVLEDPAFASLAVPSSLEELAGSASGGGDGLPSPARHLTSSLSASALLTSSSSSTLTGVGSQSPMTRAASVRASIRLSGDLAAAGVLSSGGGGSGASSLPSSSPDTPGSGSGGANTPGSSTPSSRPLTGILKSSSASRLTAPPSPSSGAGAGGGGNGATGGFEEAKAQAAQVLAAISGGGDASKPPSTPLTAFLSTLRLEPFIPAILALGAETIDDLDEVTDMDLQSAGLKPLQQRRLREAMNKRRAGEGGDQKDPAPSSSSSQQGGKEEDVPAPTPTPSAATSSSIPTSVAVAPLETVEEDGEAASDVEGGKPTETAPAPASPPAPASITMNGETVPLASVTPAGALGSTYYEWEEYATADGFLYYNNPRTGVTQWLRPHSKSIRTLAIRAAEQAALAALVEERVKAALAKGEQRRVAEIEEMEREIERETGRGGLSTRGGNDKSPASSVSRPASRSRASSSLGGGRGVVVDDDDVFSAGHSSISLLPPPALGSPTAGSGPTRRDSLSPSLAPHPRGYYTNQGHAHTGTSAYLSTADAVARGSRGVSQGPESSLRRKSSAAGSVWGSSGGGGGGPGSVTLSAAPSSRSLTASRRSVSSSRLVAGNGEEIDVEELAHVSRAMIQELQQGGGRRASARGGPGSVAASVRSSVGGGAGGGRAMSVSGRSAGPRSVVSTSRRSTTPRSTYGSSSSRPGGGGSPAGTNSMMGGGSEYQTTASYTTHSGPDMYSDVFDAMPTMDEKTRAVLAKAYGVANPRRMGYADPRPDIRPRGVEAGTILAPPPLADGGIMTASTYPGNAAHGLSMSLPSSGTGMAAKADSVWMSQLRAHLYSSKADPKGPRTGSEVKKMWASSGLAPSEAAVGYAYRHAAIASMLDGAGDVYDRLTDPRGFTGMHRHRFDADGRGLGMAGRDLTIDYDWLMNSVDGGGPGAAPVLPGAPLADLTLHTSCSGAR